MEYFFDILKGKIKTADNNSFLIIGYFIYPFDVTKSSYVIGLLCTETIPYWSSQITISTLFVYNLKVLLDRLRISTLSW